MRISWARSVRTRHSRLLGCLLPAAVCLLPLGCNNGGKQLQADLYQRELRLQEDEIYRLEDCLCEYQAIVRDYRSEVADLKKQLAEGTPTESATKPGSITPFESPAAELQFNAPKLPDPEPLLEPTPGSDTLDEAPLFSPAASGGDSPEDLPSPADEAPPFIPGGDASAGPRATETPYPETVVALDEPSGRDRPPVAEESPPAPFAPTAQTLRPLPEPGAQEGVRLTATLAQASEGTPQTLEVSLHTAASAPPFTGAVSLMLIDPRLQGAERYLVRWDFTADEIATASDGSNRMTLPVLLPAELHIDQEIQLWARMVDQQGVKTLTMTPLAEALMNASLVQRAVGEAPETVAETIETAEWQAADAPGRSTRGRRYDSSLRLANFVEE